MEIIFCALVTESIELANPGPWMTKSMSMLSTSSNASYPVEISPTDGELSSAPFASAKFCEPTKSYLRVEPDVPASVEPI